MYLPQQKPLPMLLDQRRLPRFLFLHADIL